VLDASKLLGYVAGESFPVLAKRVGERRLTNPVVPATRDTPPTRIGSLLVKFPQILFQAYHPNLILLHAGQCSLWVLTAVVAN